MAQARVLLDERDNVVILRAAFQVPFRISRCLAILCGRRKINLSQVFAGQNVGIKEIAEKIWLVTFMHYDLEFFDHETGRVECAPNPFGARLLPMSPEENAYHQPG
jgi:hypothetical protein